MHGEPGLNPRHRVVDDLDAVAGDFGATDGEKVRGWHPVSGQRNLHVRRCVPGCAGVDDRDPAPRRPRTAQVLRPGGTTTATMTTS